MSRIHKRTEHTWWWNEAPITDVHEAINVLQQTGTTLRETHLAKRDDGTYEIQVPWVHEGSSGGDTSGSFYYQLATEVAEQLLSEELVTARKVKHWGYAETRESELVLTTAANRKLDEFKKAMEKKAESLLVPGTHTDLTGKPARLGCGRDNHRCGKLYFEYKLPQEGGRVRVYPEEDRLVMPETVAA